jgi:limonene-1,2-epoxide hydrolase
MKRNETYRPVTTAVPSALMASAVLLFSPGLAADSEIAAEPQEIRLARLALTTYEQMDWDKWILLFAEDGRLHSVMRDPVVGRQALKSRMIEFHHGIGIEPGSMTLNILNIGKVADNVVMVERMDVWYQNGTRRQVPAVGVFVFDEDGLIEVWREYYDLATLREQMQP